MRALETTGRRFRCMGAEVRSHKSQQGEQQEIELHETESLTTELQC
jgi:hypothetical protein